MLALSTANLWFVLSGFVTGCLVGMTGVGGGSLMTPILVLLFGIEPSIAVGTDLIYASITKTAGTAVHGLGRTIDWHIVRIARAGSLPMTVFTLLLFAWFGPNRRSGQPADHRHSFGDAVADWLSSDICAARLYRLHRRFVDDRPATKRGRLTVVVGMMLGILVPLSSVGAGALGATALILLYPNLPMARIVGCGHCACRAFDARGRPRAYHSSA